MESNGRISFPRTHLNACIDSLAGELMSRERSTYEQYSSYYEQLLATLHAEMYKREREVIDLQDALRTQQEAAFIDVQCQMADKSFQLLLEITALRAKITEMREHAMGQERHVRERVKEEYFQLVNSLFSLAFEQRTQFDEFRENLLESSLAIVNETRQESVQRMSAMKEKFHAATFGIHNSSLIYYYFLNLGFSVI